ncbi:bidirectional sugar transporter SWEET12-like protein [Actinidia rufa]|uniref:Bidirectional sugar transporter SWEET12-like protein n=1 Tax=Actinidia rufa TaxID=165716 RepID=A0A7J0FZC9_9ERIC|nr:bidirectional sugar transporter SWEET12-like protein [Actinidia rufa]
MDMHHPWAFIFGILGYIISFMVYLAPIQGYQSIPYLVALFSSILWIYYTCLKSNAMLLITINSVGCIIETTYIAIYIAYASKKARMTTLKMLLLLNFGGFSLIALCVYFLAKDLNRVRFPNTLGFAFGILQMVLHLIYKNCKKVLEDQKPPTVAEQGTTGTPDGFPIFSLANRVETRERNDQNVHMIEPITMEYTELTLIKFSTEEDKTNGGLKIFMKNI